MGQAETPMSLAVMEAFTTWSIKALTASARTSGKRKDALKSVGSMRESRDPE